MPTIYIDNYPYEVNAGKNLLEACLTLGIDLPYFCWHPAMGSVGACRQCAVKVYRDESDKTGKIVMSCMELVKNGLRLSVTDPSAKAFREQVIEWLMTNHPHDCPVCDEGGSCHLQDMTVMTGHDYRRYQYKKRTYTNQYLGPFINHEMNRCIQCYRCVRYYRDYAGGDDLNVFAAHNHVYFGREKDGVLESPFSGNLAEICPTGVFTDKTLKEHYTRKWDLTSAPSVCQHCSVGCNIIAGERYGELRSITNRYNGEVNGYFLCDRGRFGYEFVNSENRIVQPLLRSRLNEAVDEKDLLDHLSIILNNHTLIGVGSPRASLESNFALSQLVGRENFYSCLSDDDTFLEKRIVEILDTRGVIPASLSEIEDADAIVILGEDIWNIAPVMALAVRQSVMRTSAAKALEKTQLPAWHDIAVKELVQEDKGFLANIGIYASPLDEISSVSMQAAPEDVARIGFAIANLIDTSSGVVTELETGAAQLAGKIANMLNNCKRPVIISGTSARNEAVVSAAYNIALALQHSGKKSRIAFALPECNSMGLAMMRASSLENAMRKLTREQNITAVILEQDLYRYQQSKMVDEFLNRCKHIVVLDSLHNATTQRANVLIPVSTFAEGDGTLVNFEGRAQRSYQVMMPANSFVTESWKWLRKMKSLRAIVPSFEEPHPDELLTSLEGSIENFKGVSEAGPPREFRIHGEYIPREPHRYSGRTAIYANQNVSEDKPYSDGDSPLSFTMEGYSGIPPSALIPFFWSPGWNSVQATNKYQQEVGGALKGGDPGVRLFGNTSGNNPSFYKEHPEPFKQRREKWLLLPRYHVFGSDELSVYTKGVRELSPEPYIGLSPADASKLGVAEKGIVTIDIGAQQFACPLKIIPELTNGIVLLPKGLSEMKGVNWGSWAEVYAGKPKTAKA